MTFRDHFLATMHERRQHHRGGLDHAYLTRAARSYVWLMRGTPATQWRHPEDDPA